ncbi:hypothetical protein GPJ56_003184 [Histomonas meleagridis]|uniref:uncharacterized protein n=1 Tax=Histomonas meleagridis TaxID=135588 RepID=UPI003559A15A|nr:hypothetical protein GPJ56_003184 [Histomonas meleagridis]KAH0801217.1 hypothetical protein GO595_005812 [Histomonas meleagridis]
MKLFFTAFNSVQGVCSESDALNSLGYTKEKLQYANFLTKSGWRSTALLVNDFITDENIQLIKVLMDSETTLYEKVSACAKLVNSAVEHGLISKFYAYSFVPSITMFYCKSEEQHTGSEYKNPFRLAYENMPHLIQDVSFQKAIFYDEEKCKYLSSIVTNPQKFIMLPKAVEILESTGDVALASQIL